MYTVFYFKSPACAPCEMMSPIIDGLTIEYEGEIEFVSIDTTDEQNASLVEAANIAVLPTLVFVIEGEEQMRVEGGLGTEAIKEAIDTAFFEDAEPDIGPNIDVPPTVRLFETLVLGFALYGFSKFIKNY